MVENKRVNEGVKAAHKSVYTAMQSIPEFANNPDRAEEIAVKYLKELWLPLARAGFRAKGESYQHYLDRKDSVKNTGKEIAKTLGEQFGLSKPPAPYELPSAFSHGYYPPSVSEGVQQSLAPWQGFRGVPLEFGR